RSRSVNAAIARATPARESRLAHTFRRHWQRAAQQVLQHGPLAHLDVRCDWHAPQQSEPGRRAMEIHAIDRDARSVEGFAAVPRQWYGTGRIPLIILCGEAVGADRTHRAVGQAVLNEREGVELDRHRIADMHEAVVAASDVPLDLEW